jgi:hypothetical protein
MTASYLGSREFSFVAKIGFAVALWCHGYFPALASDVLTQHNNVGRTGAVLDETQLNTTNVKVGKFGKLWRLYADGQIVAQPLYVSNLHIDTSANTSIPVVKGTFNAVVIATMHNTIYVYDADKENPGPNGQTVPLWARWFGKPRPGGKDIDMWSTNDPEWGILSTPVISEDRKVLYFVSWNDDGPNGFAFYLHAVKLIDGTDQHPPVMIGVSSTDASRPCQPQSKFNPCVHKQRAALLLSKGVLYIGFGGDGNRGELYAFDADTLAQRALWAPTPTGVNGGIWQSGQGPAADGNGDIYLMTGNGTFDANTNGSNYGSSFVKLRLEGQNLEVKDYFTPCDQKFLNNIDLDVGSAGPLLVPVNPGRIVSGGKQGILYVLSQDDMGKYSASPSGSNCENPNAVQQVLAFEQVVHNNQTHYGNIHGSPVYWAGPDTGRIYAWGENNPLKAYKFSNGKFQDFDNPAVSAFRPPLGMPGGMLAVSADGNKAGTGIVWAVVPMDGDANQQRGVKGIVLALDAQDVSKTLWTSEQFSQRDRLGLFAKFTNPMIAAGRVYVATYGDDEPRRSYPPGPNHPMQFPAQYGVVVYGLLPSPVDHPTIVNQDSDDITVVRAATTDLTLDATKCAPVDASTIDCTAALSAAAGAPAFHRAILASHIDLSLCSLLRVTTVSKDSALANTSGIGFYSSTVSEGNQAAEDSGVFVAKNQLHASGPATLRNGDAATLQDFVGITNCKSAGSAPPGRVFKPYMQFTGIGGLKIYHNWDRADNYLIDSAVTKFDRSAEVLKP